MTTFTFRRGATRPNITLPWQEEIAQNVWADLNLSTGYTFVLELVRNATVALTKTTGITGTDGSVTVAWAAGELALTVGTYQLNLRATSGGLDRDYSPDSPVRIKIVE